ncbi:MAG: lamin tail domain-containing protein [Candidatus Peribacteria bacterium]|nr:lamin tail domain-containing protein [Candidatus Peribacteria bacterium]
MFLIIYISFILEIFASFEIIEIYPNTDNDTTDEYVMIKNTSDEEASLSNFILSNKSGDS